MEMTKMGPRLPDATTAEEIERFLDRIALEISVDRNSKELHAWYLFLEGERDRRLNAQSIVEKAAERVQRIKTSRRGIF